MSGVLLDGIDPFTHKPAHVVHDNLDDRREIFCLLAKLPPRKRVSWLEWACRNATLGRSSIQPVVSSKTRQLAEAARWDNSADERLSLEIFWDLWHLDVSFQVDFEQLLKHLERSVRRWR